MVGDMIFPFKLANFSFVNSLLYSYISAAVEPLTNLLNMRKEPSATGIASAHCVSDPVFIINPLDPEKSSFSTSAIFLKSTDFLASSINSFSCLSGISTDSMGSGWAITLGILPIMLYRARPATSLNAVDINLLLDSPLTLLMHFSLLLT